MQAFYKFARSRHCALSVTLAGLITLCMLAFRRPLEAGMASHMLFQFPMLILAGGLLTPALPERLRKMIARYNQMGIAGLTLAVTVTSLWMIPLSLDLAVTQLSTDLLKFVSLLATGLALRLSWAGSARGMQAFFLIGWGMMTATVGLLYQEAPVRLCNSYLTDEQSLTGTGLIIFSAALVIAWFILLLDEKPALRQSQAR